VRYYRALRGYAWLPEDDDEDPTGVAEAAEATRDYDVGHYREVLVGSYAARLRKAFAPADFARIFQTDGQGELFAGPIAAITPRWIRCG
jgi:hypothetical protein